jgi:hypothetical protein
MTTQLLLRSGVTALFFLCLSLSIKAATLFETFDNPSVASTNNTGRTIGFDSGNWFTYGIIKPTTPNEGDRINGLYSMRMRGLANQNTLYMQFDKAGAGVVSFNYGSYSNHSGGAFVLQKSTNAGVNWTDVGDVVTVPAWSGTFLTYSAVINEPGNVRFRIFMTVTTNANTLVNIDDFMVTDYNVDQTVIPVSSVATGVYETPQSLTLTSATPGATIHFTTDGTAPTTASPVFSSPLNVTQTTRIRAIAVSDGKINSREEVVLLSFPEPIVTLAEFYNKMATTGTNLTYFKYTGEAIITYWYSTSTNNRIFYIQDQSAGLLLSDNFKKLNENYQTGDKITSLTGQINRINNTPQMYLYQDMTVVSSGNSINPEVITLSQVPDKMYQLVRINNLYFDEANGTKTFGPNSPLVIHDASMPTTTTTFRTPAVMLGNPDYINTIVPEKRNIICLVAQNSTVVATPMIFSRSMADLNIDITGLNSEKTGTFKLSANLLSIEIGEPLTISIFNISGQKLIQSSHTTGTKSFVLNTGIYLLRMNQTMHKIIIP